MKIHQKIKFIRIEKGVLQAQIAEVLEITKQQYSLYETGRREIPLHHFVTLAKYYNVSLDYLAGLIDEPRELTPQEKE